MGSEKKNNRDTLTFSVTKSEKKNHTNTQTETETRKNHTQVVKLPILSKSIKQAKWKKIKHQRTKKEANRAVSNLTKHAHMLRKQSESQTDRVRKKKQKQSENIRIKSNVKIYVFLLRFPERGLTKNFNRTLLWLILLQAETERE